MKHVAANTLWYLLSLPESLRFQASAGRVAETQQRLLFSLLRRNAETEYGRQYDFKSIRSTSDFQARVPLATYDDYQPFIQRISEGRPGVLTAEPTLLLEPTSGSTAATKLIPYTASLKKEFQRAIAPWIVDLMTNDPGLLRGQAYWSVTPVTRRSARTTGGIPIGFEDDSEYLGRWQSGLANSIFAVPPLVKLIDEMEAFRYVTLLFLLRSRSLALISVWNPTFLTLLVSRLTEWRERLVEDIAHGTISAAIAPDLLAQLSKMNRPDRRRAAEIAEAFSAAGSPGEIHRRLWPNLCLISCWANAQAARYAKELTQLFPQARLQGKGLLATEGFISFPMTGQAGAALAIRSHFFEFQEIETEAIHLAHELKEGVRYSVVITTGGGLYRYRLRDVIEVTGHDRSCPLLRFIGKEDQVSDWFGEKLNALHVEEVISQALADARIDSNFVMLACETEPSPPAYTLFIETTDQADQKLIELSQLIELMLRANYHYQYCRELGQLGALRVFRIESGATGAYLQACQALGQRAGDIKPASLSKIDGWSRVFRGQFAT